MGINNISIHGNIDKNQTKCKSSVKKPALVQTTVLRKDTDGTAEIHYAIPNYGQAIVYIQNADKIRPGTKLYTNDVQYRKNLLLNAGLRPQDEYKIRSIVGTEELKDIMKEYNNNEMAYSSGKNLENVKSKKMRANLHIHTTASDGLMSVQEILDKAAEYADKVAKNNPKTNNAPFTIAITDHDTVESAQEAIKIIAKNPQKYKNLRVILGIEMTTFNDIGTNIVDMPTNTHVLVYGIDPNEKGFTNYLNKVKAKKNKIEKSMINSVNETYKKHYGIENFFDIKQAKKQFSPLKKDILGIYPNLNSYIQNKLIIEHILLKNEDILNELKKNNIPTDTNGFIDKFIEYRYKLDKNNRTLKPMQALPDFISACTKTDSEKISEILIKGFENKDFLNLYNEIQEKIDGYKLTLNSKYDYIPKFSDLADGLKTQDQVIIGLAHPLNTTTTIADKKDRYEFMEDLYSQFMKNFKNKAKFSEAYYQSYKPKMEDFKAEKSTKDFIDKISEKYYLYKTGSQDTHGLNIFTR